MFTQELRRFFEVAERFDVVVALLECAEHGHSSANRIG